MVVSRRWGRNDLKKGTPVAGAPKRWDQRDLHGKRSFDHSTHVY